MLHGIVLTALPILLSLSIHEFAHARVALAFGDDTARRQGRCTLKPWVHLDPLGTLMMVLAGFGWARPVPVNSQRLHPRRLGDIAVSAAGPLSNLALAALCAVGLRIAAAAKVSINPQADFRPIDFAVLMLAYAALINLTLCLFNLLPLFPLDGHHISRELLPAHRRQGFMAWQMQFGPWLLLGLLLGPRLLRSFNVGVDFDPLGWYMSRALVPLFTRLVGGDGALLALDALEKFRGYTPFG